MKRSSIFVTGTDTNIGKTLISAMLVSSMRAFEREIGYFKPVQTGEDSDSETIRKLTSLSRIATPAYHFARPLAPSIAASAEGKCIQLSHIAECWSSLSEISWIVEGAGGLLVPLSERETIRDLIHYLKLPVLLVASTKLGTINHTLLSIEAAQRSSLTIQGIILSGEESPELAETLTKFSKIPILARVPKLSVINHETVENYSREFFPPSILNRIFG